MQLAKREKYFIALAVMFIVLALFIQLVIAPFFEKKESLQSNLALKQKDSNTLARRLATRPKNFTLFSYLEKAAGDAGIKDNIKYMKPSASTSKGSFKESLVEMKLEHITLGQMVGYLRLIEAPDKLVSIKRISIQSNTKETSYLDAILQVLTFTE